MDGAASLSRGAGRAFIELFSLVPIARAFLLFLSALVSPRVNFKIRQPSEEQSYQDHNKNDFCVHNETSLCLQIMTKYNHTDEPVRNDRCRNTG